MLKACRSEINCEFEPDLKNWKFCSVTSYFKNVDSSSEDFLEILRFLQKTVSDIAEN